ncbi:MAG: hypothetical protein R3F61_01625 [Myxococcota bacterium]
MSFRDALTPEERAEHRSESVRWVLRLAAKGFLCLTLAPLPFVWGAERMLDHLGMGLGGSTPGDPIETGLLLGGAAVIVAAVLGILGARRPLRIALAFGLGLLGFGSAVGMFEVAELWRRTQQDRLIEARQQAFRDHVAAIPLDYRRPDGSGFVWSGDVLFAVRVGNDITTSAVGRRGEDGSFAVWRFGRARSYEGTEAALREAVAADGTGFTDAYTLEVVQLPGHPEHLGVPTPDYSWRTPRELRRVEYRFPWLQL